MHLHPAQQALRQIADPDRARINQGFFKTGPGQYGAGDTFLGVRVPDVRRIAHTYRTTPLPDILHILTSSKHEERLLALIMLTERFQKSESSTQQELVEAYLSHTKHINNWDLVDTSASKILGAWVYIHEPFPSPTLTRLAHSEDLWEKRIAMIATLFPITQGDAREALRIAALLLPENHDLMHKAVGWMLREVGKHCGRPLLTAFLDTHTAHMPRTTLRYAIEHFSKAQQAHYLALPRAK